ncbi:unnamed protein product [Linum trigynum]|uniref:Uncharacterized protein n=1 Tax=Linum trigynum TaxID=586398 RepID=A0AAV2DXS3_9ROSI
MILIGSSNEAKGSYPCVVCIYYVYGCLQEEMRRIHLEAVEQGNPMSGAEIVRRVLQKAPSYVRKEDLISERDKELEAHLETSLADADKQRQEFEDKIKSQQDQIEKQEQEIRGHKVTIDALQASHDSLKEYVKSLAAKINGGSI